jgi:hypothetical protein
MTNNVSDPGDRSPVLPDLYSAPQDFLPPEIAFTPFMEAVSILTEAQMAYGRALLCANAAMFGALAGHPMVEPEERPSVAARACPNFHTRERVFVEVRTSQMR